MEGFVFGEITDHSTVLLTYFVEFRKPWIVRVSSWGLRIKVSIKRDQICCFHSQRY